MRTKRTSPSSRLDSAQLAMLISIVIEESGGKLDRAQFNDSMMMLFENIARFENEPGRLCQRYLKFLWQSYRSACPAPTGSTKS